MAFLLRRVNPLFSNLRFLQYRHAASSASGITLASVPCSNNKSVEVENPNSSSDVGARKVSSSTCFVSSDARKLTESVDKVVQRLQAAENDQSDGFTDNGFPFVIKDIPGEINKVQLTVKVPDGNNINFIVDLIDGINSEYSVYKGIRRVRRLICSCNSHKQVSLKEFFEGVYHHFDSHDGDDDYFNALTQIDNSIAEHIAKHIFNRHGKVEQLAWMANVKQFLQ